MGQTLTHTQRKRALTASPGRPRRVLGEGRVKLGSLHRKSLSVPSIRALAKTLPASLTPTPSLQADLRSAITRRKIV
jgi:hypothetical protein